MPTSADDLVTLLARCALRDAKALEQLYKSTSSQLFAVALRIVNRRDWAEDVVQEGFVKIWAHANGYRADRGAPLTWMVRIVRNTAIDWLRRQPPEVNAAYEVDEAHDHNAPSPAAQLNDSREAEQLRKCLETLDDAQRKALTLAYFRGFTHQQLATRLKSPLGTVKSWIRRGLQGLKRCLEP